MKKVGIMGGTFNPIHFGHLFLAENAYEQVGLDEILFMPTKNPPHKQKTDIISDEHRINMVSLAIEDNSHFSLSTIELEREGTTYTADTLAQLKHENPDNDYYFIVGADSFFDMPEWKTPKTIFDLSTILVAGRDHVKVEKLEKQLEYFKSNYNARIVILDMPTIQFSSVKIRERILYNKSIRYYVPDKVTTYIRDNHLYIADIPLYK